MKRPPHSLDALGFQLEQMVQPSGVSGAPLPMQGAGQRGTPQQAPPQGPGGSPQAAPMAAAQAQPGEPPKDSIEGAILGLLHTTIDGLVSAVPRQMQASTKVDRTTRPVRIELGGRNSQGLTSRLVITVDLDQALQGLRASAQLVLVSQNNQPVANPSQVFVARRTDSVKGIAKQFAQWLTQAEALQMQPVGAQGQAVQL